MTQEQLKNLLGKLDEKRTQIVNKIDYAKTEERRIYFEGQLVGHDAVTYQIELHLSSENR